jgi:hypothetical protein
MVVDLSCGWKMSDWQDRGRSWLTYGKDNQNYSYINIPKCASTWMKDQFGGQEHNYINNPVECEYVVVLRDPVERWISGAAQAFVGCSPENPHFFLNLGFNAIFDHMVFDEHTAPQKMFLDQIDYNKTVWFDCNSNLIKNYQSWADDKIISATQLLYKDQANPYNISALSSANQFPGWYDKSTVVTGWTQQQIIDVLTNHLNTCPSHLRQLQEFYADDYQLRESVKFYAAR